MSDWSNRGNAIANDFHELHIACRQRNLEKVLKLLDAGIDPNVRNELSPNGDGSNTPLWFAVQGKPKADIGIIEALIKQGANIDAQCEYGTTALHMACAWGQLEAVKFLVQGGAGLHIKDADGLTPKEVANQGYQNGGRNVEELKSIKEFFESL